MNPNLNDDSSKANNPGPSLKNKRGKIYKRSDEVRLKISQSQKARNTIPKSGIKKGQIGEEHPAYKHGKGKTRDYDAAKLEAWIQGVKANYNFRCFITGEINKENLECHHLNAWNWCVEGR